MYGFEWVGYQGHVIPIVIACAILAFLEKRLHKIVPEMFDLFVTPLVSVFVTVLVTLVAVGPIFVWAENAILGLIQALLTLPSASVPLSSACSMPPRSSRVSTRCTPPSTLASSPSTA